MKLNGKRKHIRPESLKLFYSKESRGQTAKITQAGRESGINCRTGRETRGIAVVYHKNITP